jgi:2-polyprenyl-3-methyl-5-hydroxy-6-metoxy-1,4-benzoquinol methylase
MHYHFNLNDSQRESTWRRDIPRYRLVIMAEVIEHLYTAPALVLRFISELVADDGILVLQTPNAVSLTKRLKILVGRNPYEMIREDPALPGHFREYTLDELTTLAEGSGFQILAHWFRHYFDSRYSRHLHATDRPQMVLGTVKNIVGKVLPGRLRSGVTLVLRKKAGVATTLQHPPSPPVA